uniref:Uncharacterized protein n=1 Tax=Panagrolaimus davidi TaxID=227884 RepID=A0A914PDX7_9BILA
MVYPEYLAFWIILLPFTFQNVESQTTEIFETMVLYNGSLPDSTIISIMPSSSVIPPIITPTTATATTTMNGSIVTDLSLSTLTVEVESRLPTDIGLPCK